MPPLRLRNALMVSLRALMSEWLDEGMNERTNERMTKWMSW